MSIARFGMLVAAGVLALSTGASAADLPARPIYKAPAPAPAFSWTGFYIGGHLGGAWGTTESTLQDVTIDRQCPKEVVAVAVEALAIKCVGGSRTISGLGIPISQTQTNGFVGGGQVGYNLQVSSWAVLGVEGDIAWTDVKGTSPCVILLACSTKHDWLATVTGRFGVTYDRLMFYAKGGVAWADSTYKVALGNVAAISVSDTRFGWVFGAGTEYAFAPNWSAKIEYNYIDFGNEHYNFVFGNPGNSITFGTDIKEKMHVVKAGLNYRFGGL
jgi:outer membrane immunogenic protein